MRARVNEQPSLRLKSPVMRSPPPQSLRRDLSPSVKSYSPQMSDLGARPRGQLVMMSPPAFRTTPMMNFAEDLGEESNEKKFMISHFEDE